MPLSKVQLSICTLEDKWNYQICIEQWKLITTAQPNMQYRMLKMGMTARQYLNCKFLYSLSPSILEN